MHLPPNLSKTIKGRVINWYQIFFLSQFHPSVQYKNHIIRSVIILADVLIMDVDLYSSCSIHRNYNHSTEGI